MVAFEMTAQNWCLMKLREETRLNEFNVSFRSRKYVMVAQRSFRWPQGPAIRLLFSISHDRSRRAPPAGPILGPLSPRSHLSISAASAQRHPREVESGSPSAQDKLSAFNARPTSCTSYKRSPSSSKKLFFPNLVT